MTRYFVLYENGNPVSFAYGQGRMIKAATKVGFVEVSKEEYKRARKIVLKAKVRHDAE